MSTTANHTNPYRPDIAVFLILIPFISAFNYYLTYSNIQWNGFLLFSFTVDTLQGYLAWWIVRGFILFLDRRIPFSKHLSRRLIVQLLGSLTIGMGIIIVSTELVSWLVRGRPAALNFYTVDIFIISIWFFVINGVYVGLHFYRQLQSLQEARAESRRSGGLLVKQGKQEVLLSFDTIAGLFVDGEYVAATDKTGRLFYLDGSLDRFEKELPGESFFRLNRQFLIHRNYIMGFRRIENGKIVVLVNEHERIPGEVPVSRKRAVAFKGWFRPVDNISR